LAGRTFRSALASRSGRSSASAGDGMDGVLAGASTVESSSAAILMPSAAERFIATPRSSTEIIEDSLPRTAHSERADLRIAVRTGLAQPQVTDMRAHLEATRGRPTASPAPIAGQALTGALKVTEPTQATGDSPAANEPSLDAPQARRAPVVSAAAPAVSRTDSLRMEVPAVRTVADTLAADMPAVDTAVVDTAAVDTAAVDTAAADTAASASAPNSRHRSSPIEGPALTSRAFLA
jgi:ribonuclease E